GDIPLSLWRKGQRAGLHLDVHGIDINDRALEFARRRADAAGAKVQFSRMNALTEELPAGYDVIVSSLFLHHLDDESATRLLRSMARATNHLVLVNDLRRHWGGLLLARLAALVLTWSPVVRVDAVRSVRAAFTMAEIRALAVSAGLH